MAEWLTDEQWLELVRMFGPKDTAQKAIDAARKIDPEIDELLALRNSFDAEGFARLLWPRVLRALRLNAGSSGPKSAADEKQDRELDGRLDRWRIPTASFWYILEQRVKNGKLATVNALSEQTRRSPKLTFVGRTRVGQLVEWIDAHPEQARLAWTLHDIPAGFRATGEGVLVPGLSNTALRRASR
jgi:hypothetical protein